ncbi:MAG: DUF3298 and DUF4163 domain-containing protein [Bacteroidales bacterium]|nr:DUF3298 and DUF4163 domain-containing protein [Bacteroidales bacterium]
MSKHRSTSYKIFRLTISLVIINFSVSTAFTQQPSSDFYYHFSGKIGGDLFLSMDLQSFYGSISGSYYYYYEDENFPDGFRYGKTIPLSGNCKEQGFDISEYGEDISVFIINNMENDTFRGIWEQKKENKNLELILYKNYSNGSVILKPFFLKEEHRLFANKDNPTAQIVLEFLFPENAGKTFLYDSVFFAISELIGNPDESINLPTDYLNALKDDFFDSYIKASEGIENIENTASFNWEKKVAMKTIYNENNLLSLQVDRYVYTGGAHGITMTGFLNFNTRDGHKIQLDNIVDPAHSADLQKMLNLKVRKMNGIQQSEKLSQSGFFMDTIPVSDNWYANHDGVGFLYNIYSIAPYSMGVTKLFFTFDELQGLLKPEFDFFLRKD